MTTSFVLRAVDVDHIETVKRNCMLVIFGNLRVLWVDVKIEKQMMGNGRNSVASFSVLIYCIFCVPKEILRLLGGLMFIST